MVRFRLFDLSKTYRPADLVAAVSAVLLTLLVGVVPARAADEAKPTDLEFFEKKIRPVLAAKCVECHGSEKAQANLRLDVAGAWLVGGDSGPVVVPGEPEESRLLLALRHDGSDVDMPPDGKLSDDVIRLMEVWIARGAPAPKERLGSLPKSSIDIEAGREFWSYEPPVSQPLPSVSRTDWPTDWIDAFVLARLEESGLDPSASADRATLARRLTFDLLGLPPEPEEIDAFVNDSSPAAYENFVDRLLASPQFGERWGRHWLDVVRYAESVTLRGLVFHEAWRYRDYVVDQFNADRPFDQFVREQTAGDLLSSESIKQSQRQRVATTFWTMGNSNLEDQDKRQLDMDVVDEQIDVMGKAFLAQTIGCARCHDHKFDPIPTADYYALAGILRNTQRLEHANVSGWVERPLPLPPDQEQAYAKQDAQIAKFTKQIEQTRKRIADLSPDGAGGATGQPARSADLPGIVVDDKQAKKVGFWAESKSVRTYVDDGYLHDANDGKGNKTVTFVPMLPKDGRYEVRISYTAYSNRSKSVPVTVFSGDGEKTISVNMQKTPPIDGRFLSLGEYRFEVAGQSFVLISNENTEGHVVADAVQFLPRDADEVKERTEETKESKNAPELAAEKLKLKLLERKLKKAKDVAKKRPSYMTLVEREEIRDIPIHLRGSANSLGEVVPRGFLRVVAPVRESPLPAGESGRRELAEWLSSPDNPLTARVYVNRAWHWLFGSGLVRTVDNFGTTGEMPSHPQLLDELATRFVDEGSSVKQLVRDIVTSATYRQASEASAESQKVDPENRLLSHANRRRLEAEAIRDAMLTISGELDLAAGGPTVPEDLSADYDYVAAGNRRSIYIPVFRNSLPAIFEAFDYPDPSLVVGKRTTSTVAPQALFLLNNPFVRERAEAAAVRLLANDTGSDDERVRRAFRWTLGRVPTPEETAVARETLREEIGASSSPEKAWTEVFHLLFLSLDFRYRH